VAPHRQSLRRQRRRAGADRARAAAPGNRGAVELLPDRDAAIAELDARTSRSVRFAVIVLREDDKPEAARRFRTPLLFSVQEAKGLEYENIILWNLVSRARADFGSIADGVSAAELEAEISYARAADKRDKSLERYKFFSNGLYVAMTRAVRRLYIVESATRHPLFSLLGIEEAAGQAAVTAEASSAEEWQREARKLELQGKEAQAQAIRQNILHEHAVPWQVLDPAGLAEAAAKALAPECVSSKVRRRLLEYAEIYGEADLAGRLAELGAADGWAFDRASSAVRRKHLAGFDTRNPKDALRLVDEYGVDYRSPFNFTPLMLAADAGNVEIDAHLIEYVLFQLMYALQRDHLFALYGWHRGMRSVHLLKTAERLPAAALRADRRRRDYLNGVLARNEVGRDYPYNRRLFLRVAHGHYVLNPRLELRTREGFTPVYDVMGVGRMAELGLYRYVAASRLIAAKLAQAGRGRRAEARGAER
jgi:hypothetical protein